MTIADRRGAQRVLPTFLSYGFRPFFLLAGLWSAAALLLWIVFLMLSSYAGQPKGYGSRSSMRSLLPAVHRPRC
jgi:uncharacterized protein involved in response to NO